MKQRAPPVKMEGPTYVSFNRTEQTKHEDDEDDYASE
jgi:hypothetical protein